MGDREAAYENAQQRVEEMRSFYVHLTVYLLVNLLLFIINITASPDTLWFFWPLLGWGIAVALHARRALGRRRFLGSDWEAKKVEEIMREEQG